MKGSLEWDGSARVSVDQESDLRSILAKLADQAASSRPFIVDLVLENGESLSMGVGQNRSVLSYASAEKEPPYYVSRGTTKPYTKQLTEFDYDGEPTQFDDSELIPEREAVDAMCFFLKFGRRAPFVDWRQV